MQHSFFNTLDYIYIAITFISSFVGFLRGFVKDFFSTCAWFGSGFAAAFISPYLAHYLQTSAGVTNPTAAKIAAIVVSYFAVLVTVLLLISMFSLKVKSSVMSGVDRAVGCLFGLARGIILLVSVWIVLLMFDASKKNYHFVSESKLTPRLLDIASSLMPTVISFTPKTSMKSPETMSSSIQRLLNKEMKSVKETGSIKTKETRNAVDAHIEEKQTPEITTRASQTLEQLKDYIASSIAKYYTSREIKEEPEERVTYTHKIKPKIIRVRGEGSSEIKYGCMSLLKRRAQRRAQKKEENLKREILKRLDKRL